MIKNLIAIKNVIYQLTYIIPYEQKKKSVVVFLSMITTSFLELVGVSSVYPLLQLMVDSDENKDKWYITLLYTFFPELTKTGMILSICIMIIIVFLLKNGIAIICSYLQVRFAVLFQKEMSTNMLNSYMSRPYEFFVNTNSSILIRGINRDTDSVYQILLSIFQAMGEILTITMLAFYLFSIDWTTTIMSLLLCGGCFLFIVILFKNPSKKAGKLASDAFSSQVAYSYQAINGIKEISVLDRKSYFVNRFEHAASDYANSRMISGLIDACPDRILEGICISGFMLIVCIRLIHEGDITAIIPLLGVFTMGAFRILPSASKLSSRVNNIVYFRIGLQNCYENFKAVEIMDGRVSNLQMGVFTDCDGGHKSNIKTEKKQSMGDFSCGEDSLHKEAISFMEAVKVIDITWNYENNNNKVLHNLSMEISKGESVAFIGSSGAGKTTLADVIMGLLQPQSGNVTMDGYDIFEIPHIWHKQIGYVPQSVYLIDDTIRANVAFGLPEDMTSDEKVWSALEQAQLKSFVENLPDGLDTIVGERGIKFSGGQRQRIALARALYEEPEILVLDEATSALDSETEAAVMESIEHLQGHKTLIIIAHRLTTIRNCDRIYEIANGKAIERSHTDVFGTPE